jgi:ankyrin repeat protein
MSLSQLPDELLLWIGRYLTNEALALLCFYNVKLRSTFASEICDCKIASRVLLWAAKIGDMKTMELALKYGGDVNFKEWNGLTALSFVAERGDVAMANLILKVKDADHYGQGTGHQSPLWWASQMGHEAVVELLVEKENPDAIIAAGADVNMGAYDGRTPLMYAVQTGYKKGVEILLGAQGIDIHIKDAGGETAMSLAGSNECAELVDLLRAAG